MLRPVCLAVCLFLLTAPASALASEACDGGPRTDPRPPSVWREIFAYDASADLGVQVAGSRTVGGATITDLTFVARPDRPGERLAAYVVRPASGPASMAGVLWVHWLGEPATTNRTEFLDEA